MQKIGRATVALSFAGALLLAGSSRAAAHCDTLDGPVVSDARAALTAGDVTPVLKWVPADREPELRAAFGQATSVRSLGPAAQALADRFFFETLVRIHRDGEGAPYTGLKPEGTAIDPAIAGADRALETGDVGALVRLVTARADEGLRQRYERAAAARRLASRSVESGRAYVAAYVDLMHYAERLLEAAGGQADAHDVHPATGPPSHSATGARSAPGHVH